MILYIFQGETIKYVYLQWRQWYSLQISLLQLPGTWAAKSLTVRSASRHCPWPKKKKNVKTEEKRKDKGIQKEGRKTRVSWKHGNHGKNMHHKRGSLSIASEWLCKRMIKYVCIMAYLIALWRSLEIRGKSNLVM